MGKKNRNRKNSHDSSPAFPLFANPREALHWWRGKLRDGFPPTGADQHLAALDSAAASEQERLEIQALNRIAGKAVEPSGRLNSLSGTLSSFIAEPGSTRLFVASATGGITCLDRVSGKRLWNIEPERAFQVGGLAILDDTLFYTDSWRDKLLAVSCRTGEQKWCVDKAEDGSSLLCPAGVTVAHSNDKKYLLLCDSGNHRICSFTPEGDPLTVCGQRGLIWEGIAHVHSAPDGSVVPPHFEYPRGITVAAEQDGKNSVFVWDSGNGRLVLLSSELAPSSTVEIVPGGQPRPRLAGQVSVLNGPSGAVIAVIDDVERTLSLRSSLGGPLWTVDLATLMKSPTRKLECFRIDCAGANQDGTLLLSSSGGIWRIPLESLDAARLSAELLCLYPEDCRIVLARAGLANGNLGGAWHEISPALDHNALVQGLLAGCDILSDEFLLIIKHLDELAESLRQNNLDSDASALEQALLSRLDDFGRITLKELLRLSRPSPGEIERWSDAHTEVDMELFQSRGRKSTAELTRDDHLEQVRELKPSIRKLGWQLRKLHGLLAPRHNSGWPAGIAGELLDELKTNLDKRVSIVAAAAAGLQYERDPQRVSSKEIQAAHAAMLSISALDSAAMVLAGEFSCLAHQFPELLNNGRRAQLAALAGTATGLECRKFIADLAGDVPAGEPAVNPLPDNELFEDGICAKTKVLVEYMVSYLAKVQDGGNSGGQFGRVLERQRNLFAIKASLLSNYQRPGEDCLELLTQARTIAGDAWLESRCLRLTETQVEHKG